MWQGRAGGCPGPLHGLGCRHSTLLAGPNSNRPAALWDEPNGLGLRKAAVLQYGMHAMMLPLCWLLFVPNRSLTT